MFDLIVRSAKLAAKKETVDIGVTKGIITAIESKLAGETAFEYDAKGYLVTPPFVDSHFHLDSALSLGHPRMNKSGTLFEGIKIWDELKPSLTAEAIKKRAIKMLHWSIARGTLAVRTHVDVSDPTLLTVDALLDVKREMSKWIDIQLVAFPQDGLFRSPNGKKLLLQALDKGVDVVGGIPHFERSMTDGRNAITWLCELANDRDLQVDMHCDESDDPLSRHIEHLTHETYRLSLGPRTTASHLTSMHSMDNDYVSKLLPLMYESGLQVVSNPLINIHLQGRHDTYPKRRGITRVPELLDAGINVAYGHDCVMDSWYPLGSHDMLEVAHMGAHCVQMMGSEQLKTAFDMVTWRGADIMRLDHYGIKVGKQADFVVLQAKNRLDAIRLKPARLAVFRKGEMISSSPENVATLKLGEEDFVVDFLTTK